MKTTTINSKENICGTNNRTSGQNLMRAITGSESPIGIPPYHYGEMMEILEKALAPDERELLCWGYGFFCERTTQKEIAKKLGVPPLEISRRFYEIIGKLQKFPYKSQLKALVPSLDELFSEVAKLREMEANVADTTNTIDADALYQKFDVLREEDDALEAENLKLMYELEEAKRNLAEAQKRTEQMAARLATVNEELASAKEKVAHAEARAEAVKSAFDRSLEAAKQIFVARVTGTEINLEKEVTLSA